MDRAQKFLLDNGFNDLFLGGKSGNKGSYISDIMEEYKHDSKPQKQNELTKREHFAFEYSKILFGRNQYTDKEISDISVRHSDELLKRLSSDSISSSNSEP